MPAFLEVKTLTGKSFRVQAKQFVLATGGIENARLLLNSQGLGNENDVVGRYFMDHPHYSQAGAIAMRRPPADLEPYDESRTRLRSLPLPRPSTTSGSGTTTSNSRGTSLAVTSSIRGAASTTSAHSSEKRKLV